MFGSFSFTETTFTGDSKKEYALSCASGSYVLTGNAATLLVGRALQGSAGSYTFTGTNTTLKVARKFSGAAGSYTLTGNNAVLKFNRNLNCSTGAYVFTGASIIETDGHKMIAVGGSYNETGYDATLTVAKSFNLGSGTYTFIGNDAILFYRDNGVLTVTKGGIDKKKTQSKVYKDSRQEVEDDIAKAIAKVTGEDKVSEPIIEDKVDEVKAIEEDRNAKLQAQILEAQAQLLQAEIDLLIQAELEDEESLMLLL
jgi:hypothetical protein